MAIKSDSPGDDMRDMAADKMENAGVLMRKGSKRGKKRVGRRKGGKRGS